jgi:hypothetical protein
VSDTILEIEDKNDTLTVPFIHSAVYSFFFYFFTEWLPLAVMFATHIIQWRIVAQKIRLEKEEENVTFEEDRDGTILSADNNKVQN